MALARSPSLSADLRRTHARRGSGAAQEAPGAGATAPQRLLDVLAALARASAPAPVARLAEASGVATGPARRALERLRDCRLAERAAAGGCYALGPQALRLAALVLHHHPIERLARPVLRALVRETGESATLTVLLPEELTASCVAVEYGGAALQYELPVGERKDLQAGASCKPLLAHLPPAERLRWAQRGLPHGVMPPLKVAAAVALEAELDGIRRQGHAFSRGERLPGAVGIGAPVFGAAGVLAVLALTIPESRFAEVRRATLAAAVMDQAGRLSHLLGHERTAAMQQETFA